MYTLSNTTLDVHLHLNIQFINYPRKEPPHKETRKKSYFFSAPPLELSGKRKKVSKEGSFLVARLLPPSLSGRATKKATFLRLP